MTPEQYINEHNLNPLTDNEIKRGKQTLKIRGTDEYVNWTEVYTRISAGMAMSDIAEIYGNGRKIALFAQLDGVTINDTLSKTLDNEIVQRRAMDSLATSDPIIVRTMKEMANEYAPDAARKISLLSIKLIDKAEEIIDEQDPTTNDLLNISRAIQTMSDTIELTQRHASGATTNLNMQIDGFSIIEDIKPPDTDVIDVDVGGDE